MGMASKRLNIPVLSIGERFDLDIDLDSPAYPGQVELGRGASSQGTLESEKMGKEFHNQMIGAARTAEAMDAKAVGGHRSSGARAERPDSIQGAGNGVCAGRAPPTCRGHCHGRDEAAGARGIKGRARRRAGTGRPSKGGGSPQASLQAGGPAPFYGRDWQAGTLASLRIPVSRGLGGKGERARRGGEEHEQLRKDSSKIRRESRAPRSLWFS